ncbi:MAG: amidohydrolase [Treponema sp.]|nr:amidohydrolase [Treponema sp.]
MKIIYNGKVYLQREEFSEAILVDSGRIVKTGSSKDLLNELPSGAEKIDAGGALILPAFSDSHLHMMSMGRRAQGIECTGAKSFDEVVKRGKDIIAKNKPRPGSYLRGGGLNPDLFSAGEKRSITKDDLDKISTEHPVIISRHCGHIVFCNTLALKMAGLLDSAPDIEGGTVEKDPSGRPTGVFKENANSLVYKPVPDPTIEDAKDYLRYSVKHAHSLGITSVGSQDSGGDDFDWVKRAYNELYDEYRSEGRPGLRVTLQCGIGLSEEALDAQLARTAEHGKYNEKIGAKLLTLWEDSDWGIFLKAGSIKIFADGTLGGHTAWMRQPFKDKSDTSGYPLMDPTMLERFVIKAARGGMQVVIHAIGDAAMDACLDSFEKVTEPGRNPLRHGIIHCQLTRQDILERMAKNQILALVQPIFLADDIHVLESRVGQEHALTSYAWASMERLGIPVSYGTDAPISGLDPIPCIEWAVARRNTKDPSSKSYNEKENVDVYTAVDAYTMGSAHANLDDDRLGRIAQGMLADFTFLDRDIFTIPIEDIHKAKVLRTICAGETVYQS